MSVLSICIPTFNRCADLDKLLSSAHKAITRLNLQDAIEIVISDNCSEDATPRVVADWQSRLGGIRYERNQVNLGYAANINKAVEMAASGYCWLMGSDDTIVCEGLAAIMKSLSAGHDVVLGDPVTRGAVRNYFDERPAQVFRISCGNDYAAYLARCREISAAFAFISTIVISKDFWQSAKCTDWELAHPYTHMLRICRQIAERGAQVHYLGCPIVNAGHNGNEWNRTVLPHFELDLKTLEYVAQTIFKSFPAVREAYGHIFRRQYNWLHVLKARVEADWDRWQSLAPTLLAYGFSRIVVSKTAADRLLFGSYMFAKRCR